MEGSEGFKVITDLIVVAIGIYFIFVGWTGGSVPSALLLVIGVIILLEQFLDLFGHH